MATVLDILNALRANGGMASSPQLQALVGPPNVTNAALQLAPQFRAPGKGYSEDANGGGCSGGRGKYSGGGKFTFTSTGGSSVVTVSIDVTGASIPADSYLVVTRNTNGDSVTEVACDDQPTPLGVNGVDIEAIDIANQRAQEQPLQLPATKNVRISVRFAPGSVAGDIVTMMLWRRGWAVTQGTYCQA